jgi:hypothetical protein
MQLMPAQFIQSIPSYNHPSYHVPSFSASSPSL